MRIGMVQPGRVRGRGKRGTLSGRECQKTRRPFPVDGWNRASTTASMTVDARAFVPRRRRRCCFVSRADDCDGGNCRNHTVTAANGQCREERPVFRDMRQVSPDTIAPSRKPYSRVKEIP